jgi:hypothetical protein
VNGHYLDFGLEVGQGKIIQSPERLSKMSAQENFRLRACELAEEVRAGHWDHIKEKARPVTACPEMVAELERRCPGSDF